MNHDLFFPISFTGTFLLFVVAAIGMLLAPLLLGLFLRPRKPNAEKDAVYECGEPTIGSSNIQFDLRFYVVALLFIVFDVEVAFFFPWAVVFGKANTLANRNLSPTQRLAVSEDLLDKKPVVAESAEKSETPRQMSAGGAKGIERHQAKTMQKIAMFDLLAFFGILLVGFAYVWKRGDLDWVRSLAREKASQPPLSPLVAAAYQEKMSAASR